MALRGVRGIRLSVLTDETTSPERQRASTDYAAATEGIEFDGREALDLGVSASKVSPFDRPELGKWLAEPDTFDALVWWRFDRLIRSMADMHSIAAWGAEHRKVIVFAEGPGGKLVLDFRNPLDPVAQLMLTVFAFAAQMEALAIQERVAGAQAALRTMPLRWRGSRPPYGYQPQKLGVGWTLVPDPHAAEVVSEIVKALRRGKSVQSIALSLTERGELSPRDYWGAKKGRSTGGKSGTGSRTKFAWSPQAIVKILTSPTAIGWKTHGGRPVRDADGAPVLATTTPLMTRAEYDEVCALLDARSPANPTERTTTNALLSGVLLCAGCGGRMYLVRNNSRPPSYLCGWRSRRERCDAPAGIKQEWAEDYAVRAFLRAVGGLEITETRVIPGYDPAPEIEATAAEYAAHQEQRGRQQSRAAAEAWQRRADGLDARLAALEAREAVPPRTVVTGTGDRYADTWRSADTAGRRQMMTDAGFTVRAARGTSGGWRALDTSRMTWDIADADLAAAAERMVGIAEDEGR